MLQGYFCVIKYIPWYSFSITVRDFSDCIIYGGMFENFRSYKISICQAHKQVRWISLFCVIDDRSNLLYVIDVSYQVVESLRSLIKQSSCKINSMKPVSHFTNINFNHMPSNVLGEITYLFPNVNGCTVGVWEWVCSFIPHFMMNVIWYYAVANILYYIRVIEHFRISLYFSNLWMLNSPNFFFKCLALIISQDCAVTRHKAENKFKGVFRISMIFSSFSLIIHKFPPRSLELLQHF